jgi:hypothetical protein
MADSRIPGLSTVALADDRSIVHDKSGDVAAGKATIAGLRTYLFDTGTGRDWGDGTTQSLLSVIGDLLERVAQLEGGAWSFDRTTGLTFDSTSTTFDRT